MTVASKARRIVGWIFMALGAATALSDILTEAPYSLLNLSSTVFGSLLFVGLGWWLLRGWTSTYRRVAGWFLIAYGPHIGLFLVWGLIQERSTLSTEVLGLDILETVLALVGGCYLLRRRSLQAEGVTQ